jgi:aspartate/methionine/tyrosine aminotransferase
VAVFSGRLPRALAPNRLARALAQRRAGGLPLLDLTESNPTQAAFDYPADLLAPLSDSGGLSYRPHPFGLWEARTAVAKDYRRRGMDLDPSRLVLTASTSEAYSLLFKLLADPGDEVLVPRPSYPLFELLTMLDGVTARPYDLEYHGTWSVDCDGVERSIGRRTRALLIVNPNNPTGSFVSRGDLDRISAACAAGGVAVIADEVFADYELEPGAGLRAGRILDRRDVLAFSLGGLSKSIGLPQVKLGWMAAAGPERIVAQALERLEVICDTYLSVSTPVQIAAEALLRRGTAIRQQIARRVCANYQHVKEMTTGRPESRALLAEGGWYAVIQVPTFRSEEDLALELLAEDGVLAHPGYFFNFPSESFLIVSLLVPEAPFRTGLQRLLDRACR